MKMAREKRNMGLKIAALVVAAAFVLAPVKLPMPPGAQKPGARVTGPPQMPAYTKLQYDSMMSVNNQCPVRHGHLNPNIRPMYVNRQPVGFC